MNGPGLPAAIIGLGNPGPKHAADRHNAGFWLVERLAARGGGVFRDETRLSGSACQITFAGRSLRLLRPATYMNRSGQSVRRLMDYYQIPSTGLLVAHDDVDLPPGAARLKLNGGHGGNNGLRDIIANCGNEFPRLRLGVGHPGQKDAVADYVLHPPGRAEKAIIEEAMDEALRALEIWFTQGWQRATTYLHTATPRAATQHPPR